MRVESYGLDTLAADLRTADREIGDKVAKVTGKAMSNIKKDAQRRVRGHRHLPHLAGSFTYDVTTTSTRVTGEVGADLNRRQGPIDHFIEDGTVTNAPIPHWRPAADKEIPAWHRYLDDVAAEALGE